MAPPEQGRGTKKDHEGLVYFKTWLTPEDFAIWTREAERAGYRPRGLKLFRLKPHGGPGEVIANTKGLSKFTKGALFPDWLEHEKERDEDKRKAIATLEKMNIEVRP